LGSIVGPRIQVFPICLLRLLLYASLRHVTNVALFPQSGEECEPNRRIGQLNIPFGALIRRISEEGERVKGQATSAGHQRTSLTR
jgi:hypothetical protein